jgi:hypothetical protein
LKTVTLAQAKLTVFLRLEEKHTHWCATEVNIDVRLHVAA